MKIEIHQDAETGKYWLRLAEDNDEVIAHSHWHDEKAEAERAARILKAECSAADVVDLTQST